MNNKASTLIELLAVIVILAIIALIAVPIVVNIINDSKKSSNEESIKMYGKAIENAAGNYFLKHPEKKKVTVQELKDENLINYDESQVECKIEKIYQSGKIYLKDCTVGGTKVDYVYGEESYKDYIHLVEDTEPKGLSPGDKYTYDVNDNDTFYFYILSIEENQVNLIMDRNICGSLSDPNDPNNGKPATEENKCLARWHGSGNLSGPRDAMIALYNGTISWVNVPNMNLDHNDLENQVNSGYTGSTTYGYTNIKIEDGVGSITKKDGTKLDLSLTNNQPIKARLPKYSEVTSNEVKESGGKMKYWLVDNLNAHSNYPSSLYPKKNNLSGIDYYWTLSAYLNSSYQSYAVNENGYLSNLQSETKRGIRPVITIPISNF